MIRLNSSGMGLIALTTLLGMQLLRAAISQLVYVLRDRIGWSTIEVGLLALALFLIPFLVHWLWRAAGPKVALAALAGSVGLTRLLIQVWTGDPVPAFILSLIGMVAFLSFWPVIFGWLRDAARAEWIETFLVGLSGGLLLDVAVHGAYATYDLIWQANLGATLFILLIVLLHLAALVAFLRARPDGPAAGDLPFRRVWPWLLLGPFFFLQLNVFLNVARLAALTGWSLPPAFAWVLLAHLAGLGVIIWRRRLFVAAAPPLLVGAAAALLILSLLGWPMGWLAALALLAGQATLMLLLAAVVASLRDETGQAGLKGVALAHGVGMILLMLFLFIYYSSYDIRLPLPNSALAPLAALAAGLAALIASRRLRTVDVAVSRSPRLLFLLLLLVLPAYQQLTWPTPQPAAGQGFPVRVVNYNLHNGFDVYGHLDIEAIAQVIEAEGADIVGLQEVSRGWVINGSLDMLLWLSRRLDMPYIYAPTADPLWGNALLSRYPILAYERPSLPPDDLLLRRGFIWAEIDVGAGQRLNVINTHFHHVRADSHVRVQQIETILEFWRGEERTVFMGDLNAEPGSPEIEMALSAGFADALDLAGVTPGYTYPAEAPARRIDYIWLTPDLTVSDVVIPAVLASDHLPLAATIE